MSTKSINLALQGGGAHGAYTWGALERLLEEERLEIAAISGTSAGAMNAAMVKTGLVHGGREGAKALLAKFWGEIADQAQGRVNPLADWVSLFSNDVMKVAAASFADPLYQVQDAFTRTFSPYQWNPLNINPLRTLLERLIDFSCLDATKGPKLFVTATNVRTGKIRIFRGREINVDAYLASACLPLLFQAVEIDGEAYWDGGFMGNPALYPLFYQTECPDVVIVHVNPIERPDVPTTAPEIINRMNEVSFNSTLLRELRAIAFVQRLIAEGKIDKREMMDVHVHAIRDDETMARLNVATKTNPEREIFDHLRQAGRASADEFLRTHWSAIGERSSVDLQAMVS